MAGAMPGAGVGATHPMAEWRPDCGSADAEEAVLAATSAVTQKAPAGPAAAAAAAVAMAVSSAVMPEPGADEDGDAKGKVGKGGRRNRVHPRNWGYTTYLDRVFGMNCFGELLRLQIFPDAKVNCLVLGDLLFSRAFV
jgi:hypothetical protein